MLRGIIESSVKFRYLVLAIAGMLVLFGMARIGEMPVDVLPEFTPPYVEIQTEALGLASEEVEQLITVPLEQDLLNGVPWLSTIRSSSVPGLSSIVLVFEPGTDLTRARQVVAERLTQAASLPHVSKPPTMLQPLSTSSRVTMVGLSSKDLSLIQLSVLARWTIGPRLMGVPGVANVAIWGQRDRQLQVQVDPEKLTANNVALWDVLESAGNALWVSTLSWVEASTPGTGGFIDTANQRLGVRHISPIVTADTLSLIPLQNYRKADGTPMLLSDVAKVVEDHQPLIGDAITNDGAGLLLVVEKFPGSNALDVTRGVESALDEMKPGLPGINIDTRLYRPASFIEMGLNNMALALLPGSVLVLLVLGAFFFHGRTAVISLAAMAASLVAGGLVLYWNGATINAIALAGFAVAIGVVVDDAVVSVEGIARRLRERREAGRGQSTASIVLEALLETRGSLFYATLIILLALLPVLSVTGAMGAFFRPLAVAYTLAALASMFVALTVTPALCAILLPQAPAQPRESPLARWLQPRYEATLARFMKRPRTSVLAVAGVVLIGLAVMPSFEQSLLPQFKERDLLIHLNGVSGTSQPEMSRIANRLSVELRTVPGVRAVGAHVGRAIFGDRTVDVNSVELWASIDPTADYAKTVAAINDVVRGYPGLDRRIETYLQNRTDEILGQATGTGNSLVVRVYGEKPEELGRSAEDVRKALAGVTGIVDPRVLTPRLEPSLQVSVDLAAAQRYGLKPGDVRRAAATLLSGVQVGSLFEEQKVFDVVVWSTPETRTSLTSVSDVMIDTPDGGRVRLGDVAQVSIVPTPNVIRHEAVSRYLDVTANVQGRDVSAVAKDAADRIKQIQFPLEYHAEVLGGFADQQAAQNRLFGFGLAALIGMLFLLQAAYGSWRLALFSLLTLPSALVGGLLGAFMSGAVISLGSLIGFLMVFGLAARSGILLIKHYQRLQRVESQAFGRDLVLRGSRERLTPILTTALASGLALVPALALGDIPGLEIVRPMAVVVIGGLITGTLLNLFIVPSLYLALGVSSVSDLELSPAPVGQDDGMAGGMSRAPGMGAGE